MSVVKPPISGLAAGGSRFPLARSQAPWRPADAVTRKG